MKNIIFAMLVVVMSSMAFATPANAATWTPFAGASSFTVTAEADLDELPFGAMLAVVTAKAGCSDAFFAHINSVPLNLAADFPPQVLFCADPPASYADCIAMARGAFDATDAGLRAAYFNSVQAAQVQAVSKLSSADVILADCVLACASGSAGDECRNTCEGVHCNVLGFAQYDLDNSVTAAKTVYDASSSINRQNYINAQGACCDG